MAVQKPNWLGDKYARQYEDDTVVAAYQHRAPYPPETIDILLGLFPGRSRRVLEVGCGTGVITRLLAKSVQHIDAIDFSAAMLAAAKAEDGGDAANINWISGPAETSPLQPPYDLIVAASSLHWMDWNIVLARFQASLAPDAFLAIVQPAMADGPNLSSIIPRYSTSQEYAPFDWLTEIQRAGLFEKRGSKKTAMLAVVQSIDDFIESYHSMNGFSRRRMTTQAAADFDQEARDLLRNLYPDGIVRFQTGAEITWGVPGRA